MDASIVIVVARKLDKSCNCFFVFQCCYKRFGFFLRQHYKDFSLSTTALNFLNQCKIAINAQINIAENCRIIVSNASLMLNVNFSPFPQLETTRLILRQITVEDADALFLLRANSNIMRYISRPLAVTRQDALALIQKLIDGLNANDGITWGICLKEDPTLIGTIGYWRIIKEHYRAEIGYLLHKGYQGKGLMQEAVTTVINFAFNNMNLHSIEAVVHPANEASIKLLERNHFIKEAHFKENFFYEGKFLDTQHYSLLNTSK